MDIVTVDEPKWLDMAWRTGIEFMRCIRRIHPDESWNQSRYMTNHLIIFVEKGSLCVELDDHLLTIEVGNAIWIQPGTVRRTRAITGDGAEVDYRLHFNLSNGKIVYRCSEQALLVSDAWEIAGLLQALSGGFSDGGNNDYYYRGINMALMAKLLEISRLSGVSNDIPIPGLRRYIVRNITSKISPVELAGIVGLSLDYFSRKFKRSCGISLKEFIKREKILFIARHLVDSDLSINETAYSFGYSDSSFFCRQFKEVTGSSPQAYRLANDKQ